jgi:signal transduction histidine kinase
VTIHEGKFHQVKRMFEAVGRTVLTLHRERFGPLALDPELEPLRITVQTRETEGGFRILVADNGPGYAPAADDEPHIALNNIRERLKLMCGGTLDIRPGEGAGTVVTVTVPDRPDTVGNL